MDEALARLEAEYCPPLDPALLSAIALDYDLNTEEGIEQARSILGELREGALLEDGAGFDPSGTGAGSEAHGSGTRAESCPDTSASASPETDTTSISNGLSSLDLDDAPRDDAVALGNAEDLERLDDETKIKLLQEIFKGRASDYSIQYTLNKCDGRWQAAMEELLNHVYFEEAEHIDDDGKIASKSIDAFSEDNVGRRGRKGKAKGKRLRVLDERRSSSLPVSRAGTASPSANKWHAATADVDFISLRTGISASTVSSVYYASGTSVSKTIIALLKISTDESKQVVSDDPSVSALARDLGHDFPRIAPDYLTTLIGLTHPSAAAARELAEAISSPPGTGLDGGIQIIPHYAPFSDSDDSDAVIKKSRPAQSLRSSDGDGATVSARAAAYASARATAFSQAGAAHRRAKSDRLMGGAAAYYGQVGREYAALSAGAAAVAADQLAASQSTRTTLDLHGVDVLNAVRIAEEKVEQWWDGLGESRINGRIGAEDRRLGYSIVVGLGRHSEGGRSKLGPAISKALAQQGWRVESAGAVLVVKGRMKK